MLILLPSESNVSRQKNFYPDPRFFETSVACDAAKIFIFYFKLRKEEVAPLLFCMALLHQVIQEL